MRPLRQGFSAAVSVPEKEISKVMRLFGLTDLVRRGLFRAKVDGFVPRTQHVNLRIGFMRPLRQEFSAAVSVPVIRGS